MNPQYESNLKRVSDAEAVRAAYIAESEGFEGFDKARCIRIMRECKNNCRDAVCALESAAMIGSEA